ncbi:hypothetical protein M0813_11426 [Anaeramoeba flamelloides]|uniref:Uncharacterized protein n=1 Tax=Anaeramoeba flamelloides TaxID=1746091 RepID=A0ABQ8ZFW2_9EUKA|nr:hypothetical protein M0813_11426 [Anaeramoeba flamelloides]
MMVSLIGCYPQPPIWTNHFTVPFLFNNNGAKWEGVFYYDYENNRGRVDNFESQSDVFCGVYTTKTKCIHVVKNGWRYLYYPDYLGGKCCKCCNETMGCGILKNDWMEGAEYLGHRHFNGTDCIGWLQNGVDKNFYYVQSDVYPTLQIPCFLEMNNTKSDQIITYNRRLYNPSPISPSVFDILPENKCETFCKGENQKSWCEVFR